VFYLEAVQKNVLEGNY